MFTEEWISYYGDINSNAFFIQLINLKKKCQVIDHIKQFQELSLGVKNIPKDNLLDIFMDTLKDNIQHEVHMFEPKSFEKSFSLKRKIESKKYGSRRRA